MNGLSKTLVAATAVGGLAGTAVAQPEPPPPPPAGGGAEPASAGGPKLWAGADLAILPVGSVSQNQGGGMSQSVDTATAFAFGGLIAYRVLPALSIGFAPRLVLNVTDTQPGSEAASMIDLRVLGAYTVPIAPQFSGYGYGGLGYAHISLPSSAGMDVSNPSGPTITVGGGAAYAITPRMMLTADLSYELGFQSISADTGSGGTVSVDFHLNYLQLGAGILVAIGP